MYSTIDEVASQSGSSYVAVADIAGAVLPETASPMVETLESMYSNLVITRVPLEWGLSIEGITPGGGVPLGTLNEGFFGRTH